MTLTRTIPAGHHPPPPAHQGANVACYGTSTVVRPFDWTFTRADVERVLVKITEREPRLALAA